MDPYNQPDAFFKFLVTGSRFSSFLDFEGFDATEENILNDITFKGNLEYHYSNDLYLNFGFEQKNFDIEYKNIAPGREIRVSPLRQHDVGYIASGWKPSKNWDLKGGLRFNYFNADKNFFTVEPRFAAKYRIDDKNTLKFSTGLYNQFLHRIPRFLIADIWTASGDELDPSTSGHFIFGYTTELIPGYQFEVETYFKSYQDIYSFNQNFAAEIEADRFNENDEPVFASGAPLLNRGDGHSVGFEILLRKDVGIVTGWVGYSLANTIHNISSINSGRDFEPRHDRTHTLNLITNFDLDNSFRWLYNEPLRQDSSQWKMGLSFVFSTGQPITEPGSAYLGITAPNDPKRDVYYHPTEINQIRLPYYARLDWSLTWTLLYKTWSMSPYLQIFNIGNRENVWFATYGYEDGMPEYEEQTMFPLLPTIGINFEF